MDYMFRWLGIKFLVLSGVSEAGDAAILKPTEPEAQQSLVLRRLARHRRRPRLPGLRRPHDPQRLLL